MYSLNCCILQAGQNLILSSASYSSLEAETLTSTSVTDGRLVGIEGFLQFNHRVERLQAPATGTLAAEIGLLDRSIVISSYATEGDPLLGAFISVEGPTQATIANVACFKCGQVDAMTSGPF